MTDEQPDQSPDNNAADALENVQQAGLGAALRNAREGLGLSLNDVAGHIKFAPRQIEALEADDFEHLPETAFLRGFIRSYAKLLKLDAAPLLAMLPGKPAPAMSPAATLLEEPFPTVDSTRKLNIVWLAAALAVALLLALLAWLFGRAPSAPPVSSVSSVALPLPELSSAVTAEQTMAAPAPVANAPANKPEQEKPVQTGAPTAAIRLTFDKETWVEITDKDGKILLSQLGAAGTEQSLDGVPPFFVSIGYASGAKLYYKGKQVDLAPYAKAEVAHLTLE